MKFKRITTVSKANSKGGKRTSVPKLVLELLKIDEVNKYMLWEIEVLDNSYTIKVKPVDPDYNPDE